MENENRIRNDNQKKEKQSILVQENRQLFVGVLEASREPLHQLADNYLDFFISWIIHKVS